MRSLSFLWLAVSSVPFLFSILSFPTSLSSLLLRYPRRLLLQPPQSHQLHLDLCYQISILAVLGRHLVGGGALKPPRVQATSQPDEPKFLVVGQRSTGSFHCFPRACNMQPRLQGDQGLEKGADREPLLQTGNSMSNFVTPPSRK